jgi:hypothetical protein
MMMAVGDAKYEVPYVSQASKADSVVLRLVLGA